MTSMMRWLLLAFPITLAACNTVAGFGQDMAAAGQALSNTAGRITGREPARAAESPAAIEGSSAPRSLSPAPQPEEPK